MAPTWPGLTRISILALFFAPGAAQAQQGGAAPPQGNPIFGTLFLVVSFILIFYFLILRPQQKRQKHLQQMLGALKKGDRVLTTGGMYGTVLGVKDDVVVLKIGDDVKVEFAKSAVTAVVPSRE